MPVAVITGASRGLGRALAVALARRGWSLVLDARGEEELRAVATSLPGTAVAVPGDVRNPAHRKELLDEAVWHGGLDLLVNNASELGPSPLPALASYADGDLARVYETNVLAPLALIRLALPVLGERSGAVVNMTSDAGAEAYAGWGGYGSSKAALDHATAVLAVERPETRVYAFDPGDMRTAMHQRAYPGQDISDRPEPETVIPAFLRLLDERPESGRYRASELLNTGLAG